MRACAAAGAAFVLMVLAAVPRASAECAAPTPPAAAGPPAEPPARPPPLQALRPPSEAGAISFSAAPIARAAAVPRTQMLPEAAPFPGTLPPRAYRPYPTAPSGPQPLTVDTVAPTLAARGFREISGVRQRGRSFLAEATGPRGERLRLVLDAASGDISGMQIIGAGERR